MLDTDKGNVIRYNDTHPALPDGSNVTSLIIQGVPVDFDDATTFYNVSTVNYLAAGACNFTEGGVSLWPLDQIVADTQLYVRDAVIEYIKAQTGPISPQIEGRVVFQYGVALTPAAQSKTGMVGDTVTYTVSLMNTGSEEDTFTLTLAGNTWVTTIPSTVGPLAGGASVDVTVEVEIPSTADHRATDTVTITATSTADTTMKGSAILTTTANRYLILMPWIGRN